MNRQTLQQLMKDQALGALAPEVSALLDDYVSRDAAAAAELRALQETTALAAAAFRTSDANVSVPPFSRTAIETATRRHRSWLRVRPLAQAACILLAFGLGWRVSTSRPTPMQPESVAQRFDTLPPSRMASIWSISPERLDRPNELPRATGSRWNSPLKWPRKEGAS